MIAFFVCCLLKLHSRKKGLDKLIFINFAHAKNFDKRAGYARIAYT